MDDKPTYHYRYSISTTADRIIDDQSSTFFYAQKT